MRTIWVLLVSVVMNGTLSGGTITPYTAVGYHPRFDGIPERGRQFSASLPNEFFADVRVDGELWPLRWDVYSTRWRAEMDGNVPVSVRPVQEGLNYWAAHVNTFHNPDGPEQIVVQDLTAWPLPDGLWLAIRVEAETSSSPDVAPPTWSAQLLFFDADVDYPPLVSFEESGDLNFPPEPAVITSSERLSEERGPAMWRIGFRGPHWEVHETILDEVVAGHTHHTIVLERLGWTDVGPLVFGVPEPATWLLAMLLAPLAWSVQRHYRGESKRSLPKRRSRSGRTIPRRRQECIR